MTDTTTASVEERAALTSGADFWHTKATAGAPAIMMTDGPHGLRKQAETGDHLGIGASVPATCFPPAVGLSQSWDPALVRRVGVALGEECQAENVGVLLGPGVNIKRSPLGGRNFEYYSEDPYLSGVLASQWVQGIQSEGVGASLKHFAANEAEHDRMRSDSVVDERTLRELYLRSFQRVVETAQPWTVMCSYNKINGVYAAHNRWLLTDLLRGEWGFEGLVVSDWGAVSDSVASVAAGLDLQMPSVGAARDAEVAAAVAEGGLAEADLDLAADRVRALAVKATEAHRDGVVFDVDGHHELAREAARRSIVLLKNDADALPLDPAASLAVIGEFAERPRYQGGGSSHVNPARLDVPLEELRSRVSGAVSYSRGFTTDGSDASGLLEEAVEAARGASAAVLFLGLAAAQESEGFDREDIEVPLEQLALLEAVAAANPRVVVVLSHGGVLRLGPVVEHAAAIVDGALLGQGGGAALADVLTGAVNPSGKLSETSPMRIQDTPAFLNFPGEHSRVLYGEGIFVGYRWYDARDLEVQFPFGHGLSYTTFEYADAVASLEGSDVVVSVEVRNSGSRSGREVVQVYAGLPGSSVTRAPRSLVGFDSVELEAGASAVVAVRVPVAELAYWDDRIHRFVVEGGDYVFSVGSSSRDLRGSATVSVSGERVRIPLSLDSTLGEVLADPIAGPVVMQSIGGMFGAGDPAAGADLGTDMLKMMESIPMGRALGFAQGAVDPVQVEQLFAAANAAG